MWLIFYFVFLDLVANHEATCFQIQGTVLNFLKTVTISVVKFKYDSSWGMEQVIHQAQTFLPDRKKNWDSLSSAALLQSTTFYAASAFS